MTTRRQVARALTVTLGPAEPGAPLTQDDVRNIIRAQIAVAGTYEAWARRHDISDEYARQLANGNRPPTARILKILGLERVVTYRRKS